MRAAAAGDPAVLARLEEQMRVAGRRMRRSVQERATAIDPSLPAIGYVVLQSLLDGGSCRQVDLAGSLQADKGAVSRSVQQLLDLGLVERLADPTDGRARQLALTEAGRRRLRVVAETRRATYVDRLAGWSDDELSALVAAMTRYNRDLDR
ncbi:MarR family winged helix-turn-helix transcriptional regulator [Nocardioides donggukensis]|uniref:MarR family transcriptional regulator n=1 Tax=Nocardioides donggukensis TaxID=2774019 RepID=A0A927K831_9ACTN|nr:MarR family transcriptional regulator [Nocardioides donggukensis]MBD8870713.1 MarR family transcriptional regulator [Nocardioides donggukensis]